jgi:RNA polymerase primary sigma factor
LAGAELTGLGALLRSSPAIHQTSPGMFTLSRQFTPDDIYPIREDLHSGALLEAVISASPMLDRGLQIRLLKRHKALVVAKDSLALGGSTYLVSVIERFRDVIVQARGWTDREIALYATNDEQIPVLDDPELTVATSQLLVAVHALQLLPNGQVSGDAHGLRTDIVIANLRLVAKLAMRYAGRESMLFMDLFGHGVLGLIRAISGFDPFRGFALSTYATWWIRQQITRAIADEGSLIRVPVHAYEAVQQSRSLDRPIASSSPDRALVTAAKAALKPYLQLVAADEVEDRSMADEIDLFELRCVLLPLLDALKPAERMVIQRRIGLNDRNAETLQVVGDRMGVTRERIRQLESKALRKLRRAARKRGLSAEDLGVRIWPPLEPNAGVSGDLDSAEQKSVEGHPDGNEQPAARKKPRSAGRSVRHSRPMREPSTVDMNRRSLSINRHHRTQSRKERDLPSQPASRLPSDQDLREMASVQGSDVRIAGIDGWTADLGFVPAPSRLSREARAAVDAARHRVLDMTSS